MLPRPLAADVELVPIEIPRTVEALLQDVSQSGAPLDPLDLVGRLSTEANKTDGLTREERRGLFAVLGGLYFQGVRDVGSATWPMYWQPLSTWVSEDGSEHYNPDVALADNEIVEYWGGLSRSYVHPVLRARFGDLAWEVARYRRDQVRGSERDALTAPDVRCAGIAIDGYAEAVAQGLAGDEQFVAWRYLARAIQLSISLSDKERLSRLKVLLFSHRAKLEDKNTATPFWQYDDIVWDNRRALALSSEERNGIVAQLERSLALRSDIGTPKTFDPHIAQDAADRLKRWRSEAGETEEWKRAALVSGEAFERASAQASGLTAIVWLGDQAVRYRNIGDEDSAARVERMIRERAADAKQEMRRVSIPLDLKPGDLEAWADQVAGDSLQEGLVRFAAAFLIKKDAARESVLEQAEQAPIWARVPLSITSDEGFTKAVIKSVDEDLEGRMIYVASNRIGMEAPFLNVALVRILDRHALGPENLMAWLSQCPYFPASRAKLLQEGLKAWFQEDHTKAIHILVPQIEAALRDLLSALGGAVMRPNQDNGGFRALLLGEILYASRFRQNVPEDIQFHLKVLYQDSRGINLRNELAHGIASAELFDRGLSNWVLHTVLFIGLLRVKDNVDASGPESTKPTDP